MGWAEYGTEHRVKAKEMCDNAVGKVCWRCGDPILEGQPVEGGHIVDRAIDPNSKAIAPEHRRCNRKAGLLTGKRKSKFNPSRQW